MTCFNLQRKLFWTGELVLLPERQIPLEDEPLCGRGPQWVGAAQDASTQFSSFLGIFIQHLDSCLGVSLPPVSPRGGDRAAAHTAPAAARETGAPGWRQ